MNEVFLKRMQHMLQSEYDAYLKTLEAPAYRGLRVNTLKCSVADFRKEFPYPLQPTPFCKESFYIGNDISSLGNHPYHQCGLFYMQEPSASSAVEILDVQKGDWVLDLCAAPGGKSTQIAANLCNTGCLVSNEVDPARASVLLSNLERLGVSENIIVNANPKTLCEELQGCFDKVLVDAPCSGEGMFKKNAKAMEEWSEEHVQACHHRQSHILDSAYLALKEQGILVYSTCTYAMEENEQVIAEFLKRHPDMELIDANVSFGRSGLPYQDMPASYMRRIFPMDQGEGHFIAKLRRTSYQTKAKLVYEKESRLPSYAEQFLKDQVTCLPPYIHLQKDRLYIKQTPFLSLKHVRVLRQGILCGEMRKQRIEPHHHFYLAAALYPYFHHKIVLHKEQVPMFYSGNVIPMQCEKGYCALTYQGHILGFGKSDGMTIKNKLPKGLRCHVDQNLF